MQISILEDLDDLDFSEKRILISLSGGINSAAVLAYVAKYVEQKPKMLFLYYSHLAEHSDDTFQFVMDCVKYANKHFDGVFFEYSMNSVNDLFTSMNFIPHPRVPACTKVLKIVKILDFQRKHNIDLDLIGYVKGENRRIKRQIKNKALNKAYPISHLTDADCFSLVEKEIGWYPAIYKIKWNDKRITPFLKCHKDTMPPEQYRIAMKYASRGYGYGGSTAVFSHNNCLPCKNMQTYEYYLVKLFFPDKFEKAMKVANITGSHWGRSADSIAKAGQSASCSFCEFD